jgi:hypothetical protein
MDFIRELGALPVGCQPLLRFRSPRARSDRLRGLSVRKHQGSDISDLTGFRALAGACNARELLQAPTPGERTLPQHVIAKCAQTWYLDALAPCRDPSGACCLYRRSTGGVVLGSPLWSPASVRHALRMCTCLRLHMTGRVLLATAGHWLLELRYLCPASYSSDSNRASYLTSKVGFLLQAPGPPQQRLQRPEARPLPALRAVLLQACNCALVALATWEPSPLTPASAAAVVARYPNFRLSNAAVLGNRPCSAAV